MMSLGLDIGGANTKAVLFKNGKIDDCWYKYIPLWKEWNKLENFLNKLSKDVDPKKVGITMTAELTDKFESKKEGVEKIINAVFESFSRNRCYFFSSDGELIGGIDALDKETSKLAASNWVSSAILVGREFPDCLFIDVGSTTTDLIPVKNGEPAPEGWTDYERLKNGELVYTGILRTPPYALASEIKLAGNRVGIASDYFANMADVYRTLGLISEDNYTCDTPDGRGKDKENCMKRVARTFCSDLEELGEDLVIEAANAFYDLQVSEVSKNILRVADVHNLSKDTRIVLSGIGRKILGKKAAINSGFNQFSNIAETYCEEAALMTPAYAVGLLVYEEKG